MPPGRKRDPNSHTGRVREYFMANPEEELTKADMRVKFSLSAIQVESVLAELRRQGAVASRHEQIAYYRGAV